MLPRALQENRGINRIMSIKIDKKNGKIHVAVSLPSYEKTGIRQKINLDKIKKVLDERKIKYGNCIQAPKVSNRTEASRRGVFIFESLVTHPAAKPKRQKPPSKKLPSVTRVSKETKKQKIVD